MYWHIDEWMVDGQTYSQASQLQQSTEGCMYCHMDEWIVDGSKNDS